MSTTSPTSIVYAPRMHREFLPEGLPAAVRTLWPGLPRRSAPGTGKGPQDDAWLVPEGLPFTPAEASVCLEDMGRMDEMRHLALTPQALQDSLRLKKETDALNTFASTGTLTDPSSLSGRSALEIRRWAQTYLIMTWKQEERLLEMNRLADSYRSGARRLAAQLGSAAEEAEATPGHEDFLAAMTELFPDSGSLLPSWRFMLELFAILLPAGAVLCTADAAMLAGLAPCPVRDTIPLSGREYPLVREPAWQLCGMKGADPDRPWLLHQFTIILLDPRA